jgi:glycine/D-amino acid oxidase-like deaminating enzyme
MQAKDVGLGGRTTDIAVIGGGLQGVGLALELAGRGRHVHLFEKRDTLLSQASRQNEGKMHLGYIYAMDAELRTAALMAEGAASFSGIVRTWLERPGCELAPSEPFHYFVHQDSLLEPDTLAERYAAIHALVTQAFGSRTRDYFGMDPTLPPRRLRNAEAVALCDPAMVRGAFALPEVAIDPEPLATALTARITADAHVRIFYEAEVSNIIPDTNGVELFANTPHGLIARRYAHVVNASWEGLTTLDAAAGVAQRGAWSYRLKHYLRLRAAPSLPRVRSATVVLGGFGDVVCYHNGDIFLSWYPLGCRARNVNGPPPEQVPVSAAEGITLREGIHSGLAALIPSLRNLPTAAVRAAELCGGLIFALGTTDVDHIGSRLHQRFETGPRHFGRYHSIDTGKLTTAPLFARRMADHLMQG